MEGNASRSASNQPKKSNWVWVVEDQLGSLLWVTLRDDTNYVGIFKSFDQYGNLLLTDTVKKFIVSSSRKFSDVYCGSMIIRGESIAYFCAVDPDAYLKTFQYDEKYDCSRLRLAARKSKTKAAPFTLSQPLKYVEINEALQLLKAEEGMSPARTRAYYEMLGSDPFV